MSEYSDSDILSKFSAEESRSEAFEMLVSKYSKRIYWTVRKIVISHHDADDVVQNVFIKLWSSLPSYRGESGLYTWIYRIAINEALSTLRKDRRGLFVSRDDQSIRLEETLQSDGLHNRGDAITSAIDRAILRLPTKQRIVFNLRYYDEMPYQDMSEVLQTSVGSLKASYHHAVQKIEESLKSENFLDYD